MARRKSYFAELQRAAAQAERERRQRELAQQRALAAAQREAERSRREAERAAQQLARANAAQRAAAEREALARHQAARQDEVDVLNANLASQYEQLDQLLTATLDIDDYVDLDDLKQTAQHPPFEPGDLAKPIPNPGPPPYSPQPAYQAPPPPTGMAGLLGGKKKHEAAMAESRAAHERALARWNEECRSLDATYRAFWADWDKRENDRKARLAQAQSHYEEQCRAREAQVAAQNEELATLKTNLAFDVPEAIEEYVQIVLANSSYPDVLPLETASSFDLATRELTLTVGIPEPAALPTAKAYRYVATTDEITSTALPQKDQKIRYAGVVDQVAVRTLHEIFEADRAEKIRSIALTVVVRRLSPATGLSEDVPLVQVAAAREEFVAFDLTHVVPSATLEHLGAAVSKNPFGVVPANTSAGIRKRNTP